MAQRVRFIDRLSSIPDHRIFAVAVTIGISSIVVCRLIIEVSALITLIPPLSVMSLYALLVKLTKRWKIREDRAADNLYFLGFIFTVTSLAVSLVRFERVNADASTDVLNPTEIIGDLGIGLATTVVGLIFRIYFGSLRIDPEETEEQTRLELAAVAENTKRQIFETGEAMSYIQAQNIQIAEMGKKSIDTANKKILSSLERLDTKINAIDMPQDAITSKIEPMLSALESSVLNLTSKIDSIEIDPHVISEKAENIFMPLDSSISELQYKLNAVNPEIINDKARNLLRNLDDSIDDLRNKISSVDPNLLISSLDQAIESLVTKIDGIEIPSDIISENAAEVFTPLNETISGLSGSVNNLVRKIDGIEIPSDILSENAAEVFTPLNETISGLSGSVNNLVRKIDGIEIPSDILSENAAEVFTPLNETISTLRDKLEKLEVEPNFLKNQISPILNEVNSLQISLRKEQERFSETLMKTFDSLAQNEDVITKFASNSKLVMENHDVLTAWANRIVENERQLNEMNQILASAKENLNDTLEKIISIGDSTIDQETAYQAMLSDITEEVSRTKTGIKDLADTTSELGQNFAKVMRELAELAERETRQDNNAKNID